MPKISSSALMKPIWTLAFHFLQLSHCWTQYIPLLPFQLMCLEAKQRRNERCVFHHPFLELSKLSSFPLPPLCPGRSSPWTSHQAGPRKAPKDHAMFYAVRSHFPFQVLIPATLGSTSSQWSCERWLMLMQTWYGTAFPSPLPTCGPWGYSRNH